MLLHAEQAEQSPFDNLKQGVPLFADDLIIIDREGYAVGFSKQYKVPMWVCWTVTAEEITNKVAKRSNRFKTDSWITVSSTPADYVKSGYDRGHLAPAADMGFSVSAMNDSFLMGNMAPQLPAFNRKIWMYLETATRNIAVKEKKIAVVAGSIFYKNKPISRIGNGVAVPHVFYRCILDLTPPRKAIGFIISNEGHSEHFTAFACSIDDVEKVTGLNFFNRIGKDESELEKTFTVDIWNWGN